LLTTFLLVVLSVKGSDTTGRMNNYHKLLIRRVMTPMATESESRKS